MINVLESYVAEYIIRSYGQRVDYEGWREWCVAVGARAQVRYPAMTPEELLNQVHDRDSFIAFVRALAADEEGFQELRRAEPSRHVAHPWQNGDIASFLYTCLDYFTEKPFHKPNADPNWRMFADFLWCGKIIE